MPTSQEIGEKAVRLVELVAQFAVSAGGVWVILMKILKPYHEWRKDSLLALIKKAIESSLNTELTQLRRIVEDENACVDKLTLIFQDMSMFVEVMTDNRDRINETNELLDQVFSLDRRIDTEKAARINEMFGKLQERRKIWRQEALRTHVEKSD